MSDLALKTLADLTEEHDPRLVESDVLRLEKLGLSIRVKAEKQSDPRSGLFIGNFEVSEDARNPGMRVTCVGLPPDGVKDAVLNWSLGVLPVLAQWKGGHSCLSGTATFQATSGRFEVLSGPVVVRGELEGGGDPSTESYLGLLSEPIVQARIKKRLHWLECFAIRMGDGSVDATCRLDNRDWSPGKRVLADDARSWQGSIPVYCSRRQFLLMVPDGPPEPERPSLWSRLLGRA